MSFDKLDGVTPNDKRKGKNRPICEHVNMHMIFYIKMDINFTRKARLVDYDHKTAPPSSI